MKLSAVVFALLAGACAPQPAPPPIPGSIETTGEPVVTIDGRPITREVLEAVVDRLPEADREVVMGDPHHYEQFVERLVMGDLLYRRALEQKLHEGDGVQRALALSAREVLAAELLEQVGDAAVTDEALRKWYDQRRVQFRRPSADVAHIVVAELSLAERIVAEMGAGGNFAALAAQHSMDPSTKAQGGSIGWMEKGRLLPALDQAIFGPDAGTGVIGPVQSEIGFHVLFIAERREITPFDAVKDRVTAEVKQEAMDAYVSELRTAANVEILDAPEGDGHAGHHHGHDHAGHQH